jgi:ubiquitin C-terminal hydrolase
MSCFLLISCLSLPLTIRMTMNGDNSVLVHSGGAMGGHYYAFIKSFADGKWYQFNDSTVTPAKQSVIY